MSNDRRATTVSRSVDVDAPPESVWALVSDLPQMGELSPENTGGSWLDGAVGPVLGARFRGVNRRGWRRWSTSVQITACEPGRRFVFDVTSMGLPVARWSYDLEPRGTGCTLTESWLDRRGRVIDAIGLLATGAGHDAAYTATGIEQTLERVKRKAESHRALGS